MIPYGISGFHFYSLEAKHSSDEWIYSTGNVVHAFGYNSAESEQIWMKSGALSTLLGVGLVDFGHDPSSSDSERQAKFFVIYCQVNRTISPISRGEISTQRPSVSW